MERKVVIFDHPLIQHKLSILRDEKTSTKDFRELVNEIAMLMTFEATRDLPTEQVEVKTPCGIAKCNHIAGRKLESVPDILVFVRCNQCAHGFCLPVFGFHFQRNQ